MAAALGDADADVLMGRLAAAARTVAWTSDDTWDRIRSSLRGPLGRVASRDRPLGPGLVLRDGRVELAADADPAHDRGLVLRAAAAAASAGTALEPVGASTGWRPRRSVPATRGPTRPASRW